jgi:hypothetical protein
VQLAVISPCSGLLLTHTETEAVGGDRGAFHVQGDRAAVAEAAVGRAGDVASGQQLPVAVVGGGHGAGARHSGGSGAGDFRFAHAR